MSETAPDRVRLSELWGKWLSSFTDVSVSAINYLLQRSVTLLVCPCCMCVLVIHYFYSVSWNSASAFSASLVLLSTDDSVMHDTAWERMSRCWCILYLLYWICTQVKVQCSLLEWHFCPYSLRKRGICASGAELLLFSLHSDHMCWRCILPAERKLHLLFFVFLLASMLHPPVSLLYPFLCSCFVCVS